MAPNPTTPAQAQKLYPTPQSFAAFLNQHWPNQRINSPKSIGGVVLLGNNVGDQWLQWYATVSPNHVNYSLGDFEVTFFDIAVAASLAKGISAAEVGTGQFINQAQNALQTANYLPPNPLSGLASIGDFFSRLTQVNTWMRVLEIGVGIVLVAVALNKLLGNPAGDVAKAVRI